MWRLLKQFNDDGGATAREFVRRDVDVRYSADGKWREATLIVH